MIYLKALAFIAVIVVGILFGVSNQQLVILKFFSHTSSEYPLYIVLFLAFVSGSIVAFIYNMALRNEMKKKERKAQKRLEEMESDYQELNKYNGQENKNEEQASDMAEKK